jgi:hypothetical protein
VNQENASIMTIPSIALLQAELNEVDRPNDYEGVTVMTTSVVDNGVNVEALLGAREAFADAPEIARFQWRSTVSWVNGTHSRSDVQTFFGFSRSSSTAPRSASTSTTHCSSPRRTTGSRLWSTSLSRSAAA